MQNKISHFYLRYSMTSFFTNIIYANPSILSYNFWVLSQTAAVPKVVIPIYTYHKMIESNKCNFLYVFLTPPPLPGVRLARFHVCPLTP